MFILFVSALFACCFIACSVFGFVVDRTQGGHTISPKTLDIYCNDILDDIEHESLLDGSSGAIEHVIDYTDIEVPDHIYDSISQGSGQDILGFIKQARVEEPVFLDESDDFVYMPKEDEKEIILLKRTIPLRVKKKDIATTINIKISKSGRIKEVKPKKAKPKITHEEPDLD